MLKSSNDKLMRIKFVSDADVALNDQFTYDGVVDGFYAYKNKLSKEVALFPEKLIDLEKPEKYFYIHYQ